MSDQPFENVFRFCPTCGHRSDVTGEVPFRCSNCGFQHFFSPVTAVGGLIPNADGELLFIERAKDPGKGMLGMPGGFVDIGETGEQAMAREILEEVGLVATQLTFLASFPNTYHYRGIIHSVLDLFYICEVESFDAISLQEQEVNAIKFARPAETVYRQMAFESNRKAVQLYAANLN